MHELGIMMEVIDTVESRLEEESSCRVTRIVLQIGELSSVIPVYIEECYPAAVLGSSLENAELQIETIRATARCKSCNELFDLIPSKGICPACGCKELEPVQGREFLIKEIAIEEV